jgi:hypothetical protein
MPEGPEPPQFATAEEIREFVERYGRPYDPETDDYDRAAFVSDIKEGKNDPIYNAHSYHTKVPPRAIIPYILHYTQPGDIVLDPFCGSGMTGVAAMICADPPQDILELYPDLKDRVGPRRAILNDLSPAACHIAYNYCTPVDVDALKAEFERIMAAVKDEFDWLYGTEHYEPAVGIYDPENPEVAARLKNQVAGELSQTAKMLREAIGEHWYPTHTLDMGREMMRHGMGKQGLADVSGFWTARNRRAMAAIWATIAQTENSRIAGALRFAFTAITFRVSRRRIVYCPKDGGWASTVISGTLYIPPLNAEANVWESFAKKLDDVLELARSHHPKARTAVHLGDAANLSAIAAPAWARTTWCSSPAITASSNCPQRRESNSGPPKPIREKSNWRKR